MTIPPNQRPRILHHTNKSAQIVHLAIRIPSIDYPTQIEEFSTLIQLAPKAMLKSFLRILQSRRFPKQIKMCKYPKHIPRHPTRTKHIQKLHRLHLEAEIAIDHQEYYISDLAHVDHAGEGVGGTFYERQTPPL